MSSVVYSLQILFAFRLYQLIEPFVARSVIFRKWGVKKGKERWKKESNHDLYRIDDPDSCWIILSPCPS